MTAALGTDAERHTTPQTDAKASRPAAPATSSTSAATTGQTAAPLQDSQPLDRWPFSRNVRVVGMAPAVVKAEV
ncbi:hypothetical protein PEp14_00034 [Erwinia phage PEp14]|uniref:Uncharacterized protein n=1 Tax=Erwinia phage PEp14 TaxID=1131315 RepID=H2DE64_9CAUD|nr:hypothetical protein PEp14_00034 [Erwinia phage PEp14]AEY69623.1 hypothetical protein PEp14_00034 [Erwinia phage PEp14]